MTRPAELVLIGHAGFATDRTPKGTTAYTGGSGFAAAFAAAAILDGGVGLMAQVGDDFELDSLRRLGLNMAGVTALPGVSATFFIEQLPGGRLAFTSDLGVAAEPRFDLFPVSYLRARHVHLGSAPPRQQLAWLSFLRDKGCQARISADMFEPFVAAEPGTCRQVCDRADLIFANAAEYRGLYEGQPQPRVPVILKHGSGGIEYLADGLRYRIPAPEVDEVDPIGAGEILAGVFLALATSGLAQEQALTYAVAAATASVTEFGVAGAAVSRELQHIMTELADGARG